MLRALPVIAPASGRCAPIEPSDLTYRGHESEVPIPDIALDRLQTFPDFIPPLVVPAVRSPSPSVTALLAPPSGTTPVPWQAKRARRRPWAYALDVIVVFAVTAVVTLQGPLARNPRVQPFAQAANATIAREWHAARPAVQSVIRNAW